MSELLTALSLALVGLGLFFTIAATIGLLRLPDIYTRTHATSKTDTLGAVLTLTGVAVAFEASVPQLKLLLLALFLLVTNPTATHAITRAAREQDIDPWTADEDGEDA